MITRDLVLPSSMALAGDILCTCGNRPDTDGFLQRYDEPTGEFLDVYDCASCGAEHRYGELEAEREAMPWRAGVLEVLHCDSYESVEVCEALAAVLWDDPDVGRADLVRRVAAIVARTHDELAAGNRVFPHALELEKRNAWTVDDDVSDYELEQFADVLVGEPT